MIVMLVAGPTLRHQLNLLQQFIEGSQHTSMAPSAQVLKGVTPSGRCRWVLAELLEKLSVLLHHGHASERGANLETWDTHWIRMASGTTGA